MLTSQQGLSSAQSRSSGHHSGSPKDASTPLAGERAITGGRRRQCPTCGAPVRAGQSVCPACGSDLQKRVEIMRCRHCRQRASSQLVICPGCGRELQPAGSTLLTVGVPALLVALLAIILVGRFGLFDPFNWAEERMVAGLQVIENIAITPVRLEEVTTDDQETSTTLVALRPLAPATEDNAAANDSEPEVALPLADQAEDTAVAIAAVEAIDSPETEPVTVQEDSVATGGGEPEVVMIEATPEVPVIPAAVETPIPTETPAPTATEVPIPTATDTPAPVAVAPSTATPTDTSTEVATRARVTSLVLDANSGPKIQATGEAVQSGDAAAPAAMALPTVVPTATPTPTPAPMANYTVRSGDTLVDIAARFGIAMDELLIANGLTATSAANLSVGRVLVLPGVDNPDDERTRTYVVQPGETFVGIALRFNVSTDSLLKANGITANDARDLQAGQVIIVPTANSASNTLPVQVESTTARLTPTPEAIQYIVRSGDTVVNIARRYGTTTQALLNFNSLTETRARALKPGDILLIPRSR